MRGKIQIAKFGGRKYLIKVQYLILSLIVAVSAGRIPQVVEAASCPDVRIVFARGSGGEIGADQNYLAYKRAIETKLATTELKYEFIDLDYPAVGVGIDNLDVTLGAYFGAGEAYEFGDSVKSGVKKLDKLVNSTSCLGTKYVIGGYSQGAMVVSKSLPDLVANRIIYAATFGDPKIYLPEGKGLTPPACSGKNLSDYRMYVPDCHAYKGLLGAYMPYVPDALVGKVGTWCNKNDIFCSSHYNIKDHIAYVSDDLYEDAARVIYDKITRAFGIENRLTSPHDTAIVIDSSGSMASLLDKYKAEALRLAEETLKSGGRVALYDYRDLDDPYNPVEHCNFESCTREKIMQELEIITPDGGGDDEESLLSASFHVMQKLNWRRGATKSLVVLTDAGFLSPDRDGITYAEAVRLSKTIDPVNFYIITEPGNEELYQELAHDTGGMVVTEPGEFSLLTDYIIKRYDSLPRVEEDAATVQLPTLGIDEQIINNEGEIKVAFHTTGDKTVVILNGSILGTTDQTSFKLAGIDLASDNALLLVPVSGDLRGEATEIVFMRGTAPISVSSPAEAAIIKAPNTGKL